jgi:hypothetical protein
MPLLDFPELTKGYAISILMVLYRSHPQFMRELNIIKKPYIEVIHKYAKDTLAFFHEKPQSNTDYYQTMTKYLSGESKVSPFTVEQEKDITELQPYFDALGKLAEKWKIKAPWAVGALFTADMIELLLVIPPEEQGIPLEIFEPMIPWPPPLPPLKIEVSAWTFFEYTRDEIMCEVADRLFEYEEKLKEIGIKEYPSSLLRHARWWFEYYVNDKPLGEIAAKWINTGKGQAIPHTKNISTAIRKFSKLVGIDIKG